MATFSSRWGDELTPFSLGDEGKLCQISEIPIKTRKRLNSYTIFKQESQIRKLSVIQFDIRVSPKKWPTEFLRESEAGGLPLFVSFG